MSSYKPCRVAQPKYMPCQVAHSQHKPCNLAEPLPTHLLRCLVAKGPCSSCKSCPRRLQALSSGLAYAQALSLGREVSKPCHLFRLFQISSGVLLPKAPVVPVTPAPDSPRLAFRAYSEHIQTCKEHAGYQEFDASTKLNEQERLHSRMSPNHSISVHQRVTTFSNTTQD